MPVVLASAVTGEGIDELRSYVSAGRTLAFLGVSGVGKSTLVNTLAGAEVLRTQDVRSDGKGRHTTTHRELVQLPGGGVLLDTPGMRGCCCGTRARASSRPSATSRSSPRRAASTTAPTRPSPAAR